MNGKKRTPNRYRLIKGLSLVLLVIISLGLLLGCKQSEPVKIEIRSGSFLDSYVLDEALDLASAALVVHYKKKTETVSILSSMVTGFDTFTTAEERTLTVRYKGLSTTHTYAVTSNTPVDTPFRLTLQKNKAGDEVSISTQNVEHIVGGVAALSFEVVGEGFTVQGVTSSLGASFGHTFEKTQNGAKVVVYPTRPTSLMEVSGQVLTLLLSKSSTTTLTVQAIQIANDEREFVKIPTASIQI